MRLVAPGVEAPSTAAPAIEVTGSGSVGLLPTGSATITIDARSVGRPRCRTYDLPTGPVVYPVYNSEVRVKIVFSGTDQGHVVEGHATRMSSLSEGVRGVSID